MMMRSKIKTSSHRLVSFVVLFFTVAGCQLKDSKGPSGSESHASFYVERFEGKITQGDTQTSARTRNWGLVEESRYNYVACLKDFNRNDKIYGHAFIIQNQDKTWEVTSDNLGCLNWYKDYHFNYFAEAQFFEEKFVIQSKGLHKGQVEVRAAINPIATAQGLKLSEFIDLSKGSVSYLVPEKDQNILLAGDLRRSTSEEPRLHIGTGYITFKNGFPAEGGLELDVLFQGDVQLRLNDPEGRTFLTSLPRGRVRIDAGLVNYNVEGGASDAFPLAETPSGLKVLADTPVDTERYECGRKQVYNHVIENGSLQSEFKLRLREFPKQGRLDFYVRVLLDECEAGVPSIKPFVAYFTLGDVKDFKTSYRSISQFDTQHINNIESLLEARRATPLDLGRTGPETNDDNIRNIDRYHFSVMSIKYGGVVRETETSTTRTVRMQLSTRAQDPLMYRPIRNRNFEIYGFDAYPAGQKPPQERQLGLNQPHIVVMTDDDGYIRWNDTLAHEFYQTERFFVKEYLLRDPTTGAETRLFAVVNPWNTGWLFARDQRETTPGDLIENHLQSPRVFMTQYSMHSRSTSYDIDDFLRLHTKRSYNLVLQPQVVRHDSLNDGLFGRQYLRDGFYLLRLALIKNFQTEEISPELFVNSWEQIVRVRAGTIVTPMEFDVQDLTLMGARNRLAIEIVTLNEKALIFEPHQENVGLNDKVVDQQASLAQPDLLNPHSGLLSPSFSGPFVPLYQQQSQSLIEMQNTTTTEIIDMGKAVNEVREDYFAQTHTIENFDKRHRLKHFNLSDNNDLASLGLHSSQNPDDIRDLFLQLLEPGPSIQGLESSLNTRLCYFWTNFLLPEMLETYRQQDIEAGLPPRRINDRQMHEINFLILSNCEKATNQSDQVFKFDRKYIGGEIVDDSVRYMGGRSFNYTVNSNFSLNKGYGFNVRQNHASDLSFSAGGGIDIPFINVNVGARRAETYSTSESANYDMGGRASISYGAGAYLVVQESILRFGLQNYQRCVVIKPKADFMRNAVEGYISSLYQSEQPRTNSGFLAFLDFGTMESEDEEEIQSVKAQYGPGLLVDIMETGIRVCEDDITPGPLQAQETYYYVTQHFTSGDMQDPLDRKNRPWLLEIRSARDFRVFLESIAIHNELSEAGALDRNPVDLLAESYAHFNERLPSWPGIYSSYSYDPFFEENCDSSRNMFDMILSSAKDIITGPLVVMDGFGSLDFWQTYYCASP